MMRLCLAMMAALAVSSCDMMTEDRSDCPEGLYLSFTYNYNLERADMFGAHVGAVDVYVFDEDGKYVTKQSAANNGSDRPLAAPLYSMHIDLEPGRYKFIVLAGQKSYAEQMEGAGPRFVRTEPQPGDDMTAVAVTLETRQRATTEGGDVLYVDNKGLPLDTLWHGMETQAVEVMAEEPTYHSISLTRDTKKITISMRELEEPYTIDPDDYDMMIIDHNARLKWDNSVDRGTMPVVYTPHATWTTDDRNAGVETVRADGAATVGKIAHADFMTSRIIYNDNMADDGILSVTSRETGEEIIRVNLPDILSRLRNYENTTRYTQQEFLDRGYDYQIDFFLKGGKLAYANVSISVLSWSVRVQFAEL